jgi:hypothetical protein
MTRLCANYQSSVDPSKIPTPDEHKFPSAMDDQIGFLRDQITQLNSYAESFSLDNADLLVRPGMGGLFTAFAQCIRENLKNTFETLVDAIL